VGQHDQRLLVLDPLVFGAVLHEQRDFIEDQQQPLETAGDERLDNVLENRLGLPRDVRGGLQLLPVEVPDLLATVTTHRGLLAVTQIVEELLDLDPLVVVEILWVFEELRQTLVVKLELCLEPICEDFDGVDRDRSHGLGMILVLHGVEDVLRQLSTRVGHSNGATALADQSLHGNEDPLRLAARLLGETVLVEVVDRFSLALLVLRLPVKNDVPDPLVAQGESTPDGEQVRFARPELSLDPPPLPDRVRLVGRVVGHRKLAQYVVEQRAYRVDQEVPHSAWLGTPLALRFGLVIDRSALPDV